MRLTISESNWIDPMTMKITYSAVHLTMRHDETTLAIGSGFLYTTAGKRHLVTAWHNLSGRNSETLQRLSKSTGATPNNLVAVISLACSEPGKSGAFYTRYPILLPIEDDTQTFYKTHPQKWPRVDVAVIDLPDGIYDARTWTVQGVSKYQTEIPMQVVGQNCFHPTLISQPSAYRDHAPGDDLFIVGYPKGIFDHLMNPVWKRATVATEYDIGWYGENRFLVDSATRQGLSGGMVIQLNRGNANRNFTGRTQFGGAPYLLMGVYTGRLGDTTIEAQLGTVWKHTVVDEIIAGTDFEYHSSQIELDLKTVRKHVRDEYPKDVDVGFYTNNTIAMNSFSNHLVGELCGRTNLEVVRQTITEVEAERNPSAK